MRPAGQDCDFALNRLQLIIMHSLFIMTALINRRKRQQKTLALIQARRITTQQKLLHLLERAGIPATQSSVSRDLDELGIIKHRGFYTLPQATDGASARGLLSLVASCDCMLVARCEPGLASSVAVEIDRARFSEIAGTVAGEDTIFVALSKPNLQRTTTRKIWELFG
jgi:transcriptional regulator of arginine metabolism